MPRASRVCASDPSALVASRHTGAPNRFVYCATKAAVVGLTKAVAIDFADKGIRFAAVSHPFQASRAYIHAQLQCRVPRDHRHSLAAGPHLCSGSCGPRVLCVRVSVCTWVYAWSRVQGDAEQARKDFIARQKMGRLGSAEEIAALCVYLGSDEVASPPCLHDVTLRSLHTQPARATLLMVDGARKHSYQCPVSASEYTACTLTQCRC